MSDNLCLNCVVPSFFSTVDKIFTLVHERFLPTSFPKDISRSTVFFYRIGQYILSHNRCPARCAAICLHQNHYHQRLEFHRYAVEAEALYGSREAVKS